MIYKIFLFSVAILTALNCAFAKCANMEAYYCVPAVFEKEIPELNTGGLLGDANKQYCLGSIKLADKSVTVFFRDRQACPKPGAPVIGHLGTLCQDTGRWTDAVYWYSREQDFCTRSYDDSLKQAQADATKISPSMTRSQVRELLKNYAFLSGSFSEQYYLHPDVVLEVTFDEPQGAYSQGNKVKGSATVKTVKLPEP